MLTFLVTLIVGLAVIVLTWPRLFNLHMTLGFAQIIAMRGLLATVFFIIASILVIGGVIAFLITTKTPYLVLLCSVVLLIGGIVNTSILVNRGESVSFPVMEYIVEETNLVRVLSWNVENNQVPAEVISNIIVEQRPSFVSLPEARIETGREVVKNLAEQGIIMDLFPSETGHGDYTVVLVDRKFGEYELTEQIGRRGLAAVIVSPKDKNSNKPVFFGVHTMSPSAPSRMEGWRKGIFWLIEQCNTYPNAILAGDFNQTTAHWPAGKLGNKCTDWGTATNQQSVGTWPAKLPKYLGAQIDHIVSNNSNWQVQDFEVLDSSFNSDHRPIVGTILLDK